MWLATHTERERDVCVFDMAVENMSKSVIVQVFVN